MLNMLMFWDDLTARGPCSFQEFSFNTINFLAEKKTFGGGYIQHNLTYLFLQFGTFSLIMHLLSKIPIRNQYFCNLKHKNGIFLQKRCFYQRMASQKCKK